MSDSQQRALVSPDFSPALSAVPPLVSSAKSTCSSPPSSSNNSPSPLSGMLGDSSVADGDDPPRLDLPAPLSGTLRYPSGYALSYAHEHQLAFPAKELKSALASFVPSPDAFEDLKYRRRPGTKATSQTVPAPLYFRQAAAQHSPALLPSSPPPRSHFSPRTSPNRPPSLSNVSSFALPPPATENAGPSLPPSPALSPIDSTNRRSSWAPSSGATTMARRYSKDAAADLLLSPRIHALRAAESTSSIVEDNCEQDANHSAFAHYLFSHLGESNEDVDDTSVSLGPRGRSSDHPPLSIEAKRSVSADSVLPIRTPSLGKARRGRFFFARGSAAGTDSNAEDELDDEVTPMQKPKKPVLEPGHFIGATTDSPLSSAAPSTSALSSLSSSPSSPPIASRGRSSTRRPSDSFPSSPTEQPTPDPRGRSKLRGLGAVKRSQSPHREESETRSESGRGREPSQHSRERGKTVVEGAIGERSRTRGSRRRESREPLADVAEKDEEWGRGRDRSRNRSTSLLRRGRGREMVISGAGYGH